MSQVLASEADRNDVLVYSLAQLVVERLVVILTKLLCSR